MSDDDEECEMCPKGTEDDPAHCVHWYDGDECCRCNAPAMTEEQKQAQGMVD